MFVKILMGGKNTICAQSSYFGPVVMNFGRKIYEQMTSKQNIEQKLWYNCGNGHFKIGIVHTSNIKKDLRQTKNFFGGWLMKKQEINKF